MVVHMRVFSSDRSSRCIPNVFRSLPGFKSVCLFSCLFCRLKYICITSWGSFCDASRCLPVHMMMHWANSLVDYPERKNLLSRYMYVFTVFLLLTQLRPASSEDCQHVLRSAVFSSRTWTYVTWSPGRRSNCVWAYSRWLGRLSWVEWEEGVGGGGRVWRLILFCFRPIVPSIVHCGSNREGSQEASREKQTIVTFCEQNIVDLQ